MTSVAYRGKISRHRTIDRYASVIMVAIVIGDVISYHHNTPDEMQATIVYKSIDAFRSLEPVLTSALAFLR